MNFCNNNYVSFFLCCLHLINKSVGEQEALFHQMFNVGTSHLLHLLHFHSFIFTCKSDQIHHSLLWKRWIRSPWTLSQLVSHIATSDKEQKYSPFFIPLTSFWIVLTFVFFDLLWRPPTSLHSVLFNFLKLTWRVSFILLVLCSLFSLVDPYCSYWLLSNLFHSFQNFNADPVFTFAKKERKIETK